jgi:hypothetical protein
VIRIPKIREPNIAFNADNPDLFALPQTTAAKTKLFKNRKTTEQFSITLSLEFVETKRENFFFHADKPRSLPTWKKGKTCLKVIR